MTRSHSLASRLREVLLDGRWIANTNYQDQQADLSWQEATQQVGSLNTIAALTFHVNYYLAGILEVFRGGDLTIRDKYSFDLPPITSASDWDSLRQEFLDNAEAFVKAVEAIPDAQLDLPFVKEAYGSYLRNIEGVIEHSYYHLGQISLIRKMLIFGHGDY